MEGKAMNESAAGGDGDAMLAMFLHFAMLSLMSVGGINTVLPDVQRYVVEVNHWLTAKQFADSYALGQAAPGPNMMYVTLVGWLAGGWAGALITTVAMLVPTALLTLAVVRLDARAPDAPLGLAIRRGLAPITLGLILSSGWILVVSVNHDWRGYALTAVTALFVLRTRLNPLWLIAAGAVAGIAGIV
jgi:chromate transporter